MSEIIIGLVAIAAIIANVWHTERATARNERLREQWLKDEAKRVREWWIREQSTIDNLLDRVQAGPNWEIYAGAAQVERPSDQPAWNADGELQPGTMASSLAAAIEQARTYDEDADVLAEDFAGPIIG